MTDIEALRARMREAAKKATPGPWTRRDTPDYAEMIGEDESRPLALVGKPEDADFIALASPANVKALDAEITRLRDDLDRVTRERDGHKAESVSRGKMLVRMRDLLVNARDGLDDQGDLVAFGSTNEADMFRDAVHELEDFRWSLVLAEKDEPDLLERCRLANARAEAAEAALAKRDEEVARLREAAWLAEKAMDDCGDLRGTPAHEALIEALTKEPTNAE